MVVTLLGAPFGQAAMADVVILNGLLCADPSAVEAAIANLDMQEVERLGCTKREPYSLGFRVLRCEPQGMEVSPKSFSRTTRRDTTLPYAVCEVEAIMPDGQVVAAYTDYFLIIPWRRMRLSIPRFQAPEVQ